MTVEKFVKDWLFENGLWEDEANSVFDFFTKNNKASESIRWNDNIEGYPSHFKSALIYAVRQEAVSWLKQNKPQHFALFMLTSE